MNEILALKFNQHDTLRQMLIGTNDAELIEVPSLLPNTLFASHECFRHLPQTRSGVKVAMGQEETNSGKPSCGFATGTTDNLGPSLCFPILPLRVLRPPQSMRQEEEARLAQL